MSQRVSNRCRGFTLIELMVTVAVLAIVLTVAIPSFTNLINGNRLTSQANELLSALTYAKSEAVKTNQPVVLCHSVNGISCSEASAGGWQGWLVAPAGILNGDNVDVMASGILKSANLVMRASPLIQTNNYSVRFTSQGLIRTATGGAMNARFRVCLPVAALPQNSRVVQVRSGGRMRVQSESLSGECPTPENA